MNKRDKERRRQNLEEMEGELSDSLWFYFLYFF